MVILISIATFVSTILGGLFAIRFKDRLHLILGFSAGAVIAVAFFDLIPEAIGLGADKYDISTITSVVAMGFVIYMILDRLALLHSHEEDCENDQHDFNKRGKLGVASLSAHSFIDGVALGLAFQVSALVGIIVSTAILIHKFSDGINIVNVVLKNGGEKQKAISWLAISAVAPILGVVLTLFFSLPKTALGIILALFAGFFLYIGAVDLLPESHHRHPKIITTIMTLLGVGVLFLVIKLAGF
jgi:ZIP family zinc transporter